MDDAIGLPIAVELAAIGDLEIEPGLAALGTELPAIGLARQIDPGAGSVFLPVAIDAQGGVDVEAE